MKQNRIKITLFIGFLTFAQSGTVLCYDSAALMQDCTTAIQQYDTQTKKQVLPEEDKGAERCRSFILGAFSVLNSLQMNKEGAHLICAPNGVKQEQLVRIVKKWLTDNPAKLHLQAGIPTVLSLREAFPCANKGGKKISPVF